MSTLADVHTTLLQGVQALSAEPGLPTHTPFLAGYGAAINDLTMLLNETPMWSDPRIDPDVVARAMQIPATLRPRLLAQPEPDPAPEPAPERAMAAGAGP
jgi:hypothetical protein